MQAFEYDAIRISITQRIGAGVGSFAIGTLNAFESADGVGVNLLQGGLASASSVFGSDYSASQAFTDDATTRWASVSSSGPEWIMYLLPEKKVIRSFWIKLAVNPGNAPGDFIFEGRVAGTSVWETIGKFSDFATAEQISVGMFGFLQNKVLTGKLMLDSGAVGRLVVIFDWATGRTVEVISQFRPDGRWVTSKGILDPEIVGVLFVGPAGYRPDADGPLSWEAMT